MEVKHPLVKEGSIELRRYQEVIVGRAIEANTLVVIPTGLGKTVIAGMVAAHRLYEFPESKILFLAPTRPLVVQHQRIFEGILKESSSVVLTGKDPVKDRMKLWKENRMIFATPQTIENDILRGLNLQDVSLFIVDEAHRAVGNYSYVGIAEEYMRKARNGLILGLTASPSSRREVVDEVCGNLFIRQIEAKTEHDADVKPYIQGIEMGWIRVELPEEFKRIKEILEDLFREDVRKLKEMKYLESANLSRINKKVLLKIQADIRGEITSGEDSYISASLVASALKINHAIELLETQGISSLDSYFKRLSRQRSKAIKKLFQDPRMKNVVKIVHDLKVMGVEHPKLKKLTEVVKEYQNKKVIVFTQFRDSVDKIIEVLNENDILAHEFIGQASRDGKRGMTQKEQVNILKNFEAGKYTALVATSVAEEGIDIPKVDLVVFYEPVPSEIRSIQRRGRTGRSRAGKVIVMMAKGTRDEAYYWASVHKERKMSSVIREMGYQDKREQRSLLDYEFRKNSGEEKAVKIYVDVRERSSEILNVLKESAKVEIRQLPVADFILSDRVGVERKQREDFLQSIIDQRLLSQAKELSRNFEIPIMILEGIEDLYSMRGIHPNAVRGALASLAIDFRISVIPTKDMEDTAQLLYQIAKREQVDEDRSIVLRGEKKPLLLEEQQRYVVESLPYVSSVLARRLLERFGTVRKIMSSTEKELKKVEGIGSGKAEKIVKVLRSRYGREN